MSVEVVEIARELGKDRRYGNKLQRAGDVGGDAGAGREKLGRDAVEAHPRRRSGSVDQSHRVIVGHKKKEQGQDETGNADDAKSAACPPQRALMTPPSTTPATDPSRPARHSP